MAFTGVLQETLIGIGGRLRSWAAIYSFDRRKMAPHADL
jgi:hypothetical protein